MHKMLAAVCAAALSCALLTTGAFAASGSGSSPSSTTTAASGLDKESLMTSQEGDLFEIIGGKLALKKTHDKHVANLARTLIKDHTKSYKDAVALARKVGADVEKSPTPSEQWELLTLAKVSGTTFDRWYASLEVYDHKQDIQETTDEITMGSNSDVIANARQDLPVLRKHLRMSESALKTIK